MTLTPPPDGQLAETGWDASSNGSGRTLLIACGALAREILAIRTQHGLDHLDLVCLPALLHNRPERIPEAVRERIHKARADGYAQVVVLYGDCGTGGGLDRVCAEEGVERIEGPHCYSFFSGNADWAELDEIDAFYLTDFLVRQFDTLVWRGLGLDRHPELRDMMFGHYRKVVFLAQKDDPALDQSARAAADRLGLAYEHRPVGYGDLERYLSAIA